MDASKPQHLWGAIFDLIGPPQGGDLHKQIGHALGAGRNDLSFQGLAACQFRRLCFPQVSWEPFFYLAGSGETSLLDVAGACSRSLDPAIRAFTAGSIF